MNSLNQNKLSQLESSEANQIVLAEDEMRDAVIDGDLKRVQLLLDSGEDPSKLDSQGQSLLLLACQFESDDIVYELLKRGADPNIQDAFGNTALYYAAFNCDADLVKRLIEHGADPNSGSRGVLIAAINSDHYEVVKILLASGADVNSEQKDHDYKLMTPLHAAVLKCAKNMVELLLDHGADADKKIEFGEGKEWTPLEIAAIHRYLAEKALKEVLRGKFDFGGVVSDKTNNIRLILGYQEIIQLFLERKPQQ